jgi:hypothetical protein
VRGGGLGEGERREQARKEMEPRLQRGERVQAKGRSGRLRKSVPPNADDWLKEVRARQAWSCQLLGLTPFRSHDPVPFSIFVVSPDLKHKLRINHCLQMRPSCVPRIV